MSSTATEPALFKHCRQVYSEMALRATASDMPEYEGHHMYVGALTGLFKDLGLGQPYYTSVMDRLKAMNCVEQIVRGGGQQPSKWLLIGAPTMESFEASQGKTGNTASVNMRKAEQSIRDLGQRVSRLEAQVSRIIDMMDLADERFKSLQAEFEEYKQQERVVG